MEAQDITTQIAMMALYEDFASTSVVALATKTMVTDAGPVLYERAETQCMRMETMARYKYNITEAGAECLL